MKNFNRLNDRFFKFVFANPDYKDLLIAFLNDVLANTPKNAERLPPVTDLAYPDREAIAQSKSDKVPRFDVIAKTQDGRILHIEVQVAGDPDLLPRVLNYASRSYIKGTRAGERYADIQIVFIVLVNFKLFPDSDSWYELHRIINVETGSWRMRGMEFHFIEIPKLRAKMRKEKLWPETGLERLLYYLGSIGGEKDMITLSKEDSRVEKMLKLEQIFSEDSGLLDDYLDWEHDKWDYEASMKASREWGLSEGRAEGRAEGLSEGTMRTLVTLVINGLLSLKDAALTAGMSEAEFQAKMTKYRE